MDTELNLQTLLKNQYRDIKSRNSRFSIRAFARQLGIQPSATNEIMNGQRKVSRAFAEKLIEKLKISSEDRDLILNSHHDHSRSYSQSFAINEDNLEHAIVILRNARLEIEKISQADQAKNIEVTVIISATGLGSIIN